MKEELKKYLEAYNQSKGWSTSIGDIVESLRCEKIIHKERVCEHRWWDEWEYIVMIGNKLVSYIWAETSGDNSVADAGWEFDPSTITEVKAVQKLVTVYEEVK